MRLRSVDNILDATFIIGLQLSPEFDRHQQKHSFTERNGLKEVVNRRNNLISLFEILAQTFRHICQVDAVYQSTSMNKHIAALE